MKKILLISLCLILCSCSSYQQSNSIQKNSDVNEQVKTELPEKEIPESPLASDSPINPQNIDNYLFLDNVQYIDLRSPQQIVSEGFIAGFENIPFYEMIVSWKPEDNILFTMHKSSNSKDYIGSTGSFSPHYKESEDLLHSLFSENKQVVFFSTAGVESAYMINLLIQYGYDPSSLYNAGSFTNSVGTSISYRDNKNHKFYTEGSNSYTVNINYVWEDLTTID